MNKACPKDSFPVPKIDQMIDATAGFDRPNFLDAYSGYNQIILVEEDQEKTVFVTERGIYCFMVMPFKLKNIGTTYQRLMNKIFKDLIGKIVEVYIDDMCVKSKQKESHIEQLTRVFVVLRKFRMKLNPTKRALGVSSG